MRACSTHQPGNETATIPPVSYTPAPFAASSSAGAARPSPAARGKETALRRTTGLIASAVTALVLAGCGPGTTYKATVTGTSVLNPADLGVTVQVTNTGQSAGTPTCQITAQDPSYAYTGFSQVTLKGTLQPGQTTHFADNVTITGQGAQYVTQAAVKCS